MPEAAAAPNWKALVSEQYAKHRELLVALFVVSTIGIIIVPLPTLVMDFLLGVNITLSLILLLTTIYVGKPIEFSVFPSLLLVATLYRLSLNIATTRLILRNAPEVGELAAGQLVRTFGAFVGGENVVIGIVIFTILVIIQFVVITKGATRIAEVAARFTLDAMPGQQMAIDADLNAGLIDETQARDRREELRQLSDFYGSMDGASKFVRGDAIAGIIITLVNIVAGLVVGVLMYGMDFATAGRVFTVLTIGDGLVSQVPALLVSIASGLLVTRSASKARFAEEVLGQMFSQSRALAVAAFLIGGMGLAGVIGYPFPWFPLLVIAGICGAAWYNMNRVILDRRTEEKKKAAEDAEAPAARQEPEKVESYLHVDPMELEVGIGLVPLVDTSQSAEGGGGLLGRVQMIRQEMAQEMGIIVPPIRIRDNIQLDTNEYSIKIQACPVARGTVEPDKYLAVDSGMASEPLEGIETVEPAFQLPAVWISEANREYAEHVGYMVVDAETVLATHLTEVIKTRAHELLTREDVRRLLDTVREHAPTLVQEATPEPLSLADIQKVLQNLLRERVSIRNMSAILEVLGDIGRRTKDPEILTEYVRNALGRWICNQYQEGGKLHVVTLDPQLEDAIQQRVQNTEGGSFLAMRPEQTQAVVEAVGNEVGRQLEAGHAALLLTSPQIRAHVKRMTESALPILAVISYNEVLPQFEVVSMGVVTATL